ncbi:hypothetical protein LENED_012456 [Lentinula edodes]|uniref:Uncharacterized protein n=1 Tax=Lentinula edodes TaxID=5353 RepID=A0A1Q3ESY1_LENED|nr:hypothetical protein LENED_012456 [Lentinula edodes]
MPRNKGYAQFLSSKFVEGRGVSAPEDLPTINEAALVTPAQSSATVSTNAKEGKGRKQRTSTATCESEIFVK